MEILIDENSLDISENISTTPITKTKSITKNYGARSYQNIGRKTRLKVRMNKNFIFNIVFK